jgi:hypothetical protein
MNNKILGGVVAVIVIAAVVYFAMAKKDDTTNTETNTQTNENQNTNPPPPSGAQTNSLKGLLAGGAQKCTYSDANIQGTVYTANGKARIDMSSVTNGVTMSNHAIMDGQTYYGWVDGQPSGFKFSINQSSAGSVGSNQNVDINQQISYDCSSWSTDNSMFSVPTTVQFMDLSSYQMPTGN